MKSVIFSDRPEQIKTVYQAGRMDRIREQTDLYPHLVSGENLARHLPDLTEVKVAFSTWGMPVFSEEQLAGMPGLKALFYAAGSVKKFAPPFLARGIRVFSAWQSNGLAVAEFVVGQVLLAGKRYFQNERACRDPDRRKLGNAVLPTGLGMYSDTLAVIGCGMVARQVIGLLAPFRIRILAVDPYLSDADAATLGVEKTDLADAFRRAYVVSNHLPDLPATEGLIRGEHVRSMREGATFINTGRGRQVCEEEMLDVLEERTDLTALLDVTWPEPPIPESRAYRLNNVFLSSHIAGSMGNEVLRMADAMIREFEQWQAGEPVTCEVTTDMLDRMA